MTTVRGKVFFYGQTFRIEQGNIYFESIERINPRLDIKAVTNAGGVTIIANITGTLESPEMALSAEDPSGEPIPYSQRDIISLLAFNSSVGDSASLGNVLEERLPQVLRNYISRGVENVARTTLGVETFEIQPSESDVLDLSKTNVTIGKYLTDKIYLRYTRSLEMQEGSEDIINLEYRLTDHFSIEGRREANYNISESYRLDLKFKWEY
jgi:translocation and assembly module TamB